MANVDRILRLKEVMLITGLSKSSIYRYADGKAFPKSIPLGGRSVGWSESEISGWMQGCMEQR
ncbi:AlpA family transcriptional regulator [Vibrio kyushuensis]|uniref:AlpA family transcriptional regulator n=1 Tax=Vibrio kyushuensis TaxID=2910249 RepID=UPI003D13EDF0